MKRTALLMVLICMVTAGCGYTTASLLPADLDSIYIDNFKNEIDFTEEVSSRRPTYSYFPGLETDITRSVIDAFIFDNNLEVKGEDVSTLMLKGALVDFRQLPLSYDKNDNVVEYRLEILVNIELYDERSNEIMWVENKFMGQSSYTISGPNALTQAQAVKKAVKDLATRIVERTVEAW